MTKKIAEKLSLEAPIIPNVQSKPEKDKHIELPLWKPTTEIEYTRASETIPYPFSANWKKLRPHHFSVYYRPILNSTGQQDQKTPIYVFREAIGKDENGLIAGGKEHIFPRNALKRLAVQGSTPEIRNSFSEFLSKHESTGPQTLTHEPMLMQRKRVQKVAESETTKNVEVKTDVKCVETLPSTGIYFIIYNKLYKKKNERD